MDFSQIVGEDRIYEQEISSNINAMRYAPTNPPTKPIGKQILTVKERFEKYVDKYGPLVTNRTTLKIWPELINTRCQDWRPCNGKNKYGQFWNGQIRIDTHREAWILAYNHIPDGIWVLHKCDRRNCVNIAHLFLGNGLSNSIDKFYKCRQSSKLSLEEVSNILSEWHEMLYGDTPPPPSVAKILASKYRVSKTHIWRIVNKLSWKYLDVRK